MFYNRHKNILTDFHQYDIINIIKKKTMIPKTYWQTFVIKKSKNMLTKINQYDIINIVKEKDSKTKYSPQCGWVVWCPPVKQNHLSEKV